MSQNNNTARQAGEEDLNKLLAQDTMKPLKTNQVLEQVSGVKKIVNTIFSHRQIDRFYAENKNKFKTTIELPEITAKGLQAVHKKSIEKLQKVLTKNGNNQAISDDHSIYEDYSMFKIIGNQDNKYDHNYSCKYGVLLTHEMISLINLRKYKQLLGEKWSEGYQKYMASSEYSIENNHLLSEIYGADVSYTGELNRDGMYVEALIKEIESLNMPIDVDNYISTEIEKLKDSAIYKNEDNSSQEENNEQDSDNQNEKNIFKKAKKWFSERFSKKQSPENPTEDNSSQEENNEQDSDNQNEKNILKKAGKWFSKILSRKQSPVNHTEDNSSQEENQQDSDNQDSNNSDPLDSDGDFGEDEIDLDDMIIDPLDNDGSLGENNSASLNNNLNSNKSISKVYQNIQNGKIYIIADDGLIFKSDESGEVRQLKRRNTRQYTKKDIKFESEKAQIYIAFNKEINNTKNIDFKGGNQYEYTTADGENIPFIIKNLQPEYSASTSAGNKSAITRKINEIKVKLDNDGYFKKDLKYKDITQEYKSNLNI